MKLRIGARTDTGRVRPHNEDHFGIGTGPVPEEHGTVLIVCDGIGGYAAGDVASQLAVDLVLQLFAADPNPDRMAVIYHGLSEANRRLYARARGRMGTTAVAAALAGGLAMIANVGDSRAYLVRGTHIRQITHDHSVVSELIAAGAMTPEQARRSTERNKITRALGSQAEVLIDLFRIPVQPGDRLVLSSDGLHGWVEDPEIATMVQTEPEEAAQRLVAQANARGGQDNITVIVALVEG